MDPYIATPVINVRRQEVARILETLDPDSFYFGDPECAENASLVEDYIVASRAMPVLTIVRDISAILAKMHAAGLVHGAVNTKNIVVDIETGRARLLANNMVQMRRYAHAGDMPIGSGHCVVTVAPVHFTRSERWDTALEDVWALSVVVLQMLDPRGKQGLLNENTSPVLKLLFLSRLFLGPLDARKDFVDDILRKAKMPVGEQESLHFTQLIDLLKLWWSSPADFSSVEACELATTLEVQSVCAKPLEHAIQRVLDPGFKSEVLNYALEDLNLTFIDPKFVQDAVRDFGPHFKNKLLVEMASVMLAIKMSLHLHVKKAEVACAKIAKHFLTLDDVPRVFALETWFLMRKNL